MRYHDSHLTGYTVADYGATIVLHLSFDYPGLEKQESVIKFSAVAAYHFVHMGSAIITDITEVSLGDLIAPICAQLAEWNRQIGVPDWSGDPTEYQETLAKDGCRAWTIESAVGFQGFVIAKSVEGRSWEAGSIESIST